MKVQSTVREVLINLLAIVFGVLRLAGSLPRVRQFTGWVVQLTG